MKYTTLAATAVLAALGFTSAAQAQQSERHPWRGEAQGPHQQQQWRGQAQQHWQQGQAAPQYQQQYQQRHPYQQQYRQQVQPQYHAYNNYAPRSYSPSYYGAPQYRPYGGYAARYHVGGYAPSQYRARPYWVDWRARNLYAPPYGYQWVETDTGEMLLIALATGLIANAILAY